MGQYGSHVLTFKTKKNNLHNSVEMEFELLPQLL